MLELKEKMQQFVIENRMKWYRHVLGKNNIVKWKAYQFGLKRISKKSMVEKLVEDESKLSRCRRLETTVNLITSDECKSSHIHTCDKTNF